MQEPITKRYLELDALRGIAALSVLLFHFTYGYDYGLNLMSEKHFYFRYGNLGVQLFFMISGFVILMTLEKLNSSKEFFIARFSRLYPAYWMAIILTITLTLLLNVPFQRGIYSFSQVIINFSMLQHWLRIKDVDGAYWTLAIELVFYVILWSVYRLRKVLSIEFFSILWLSLVFMIFLIEIPYGKYARALLILDYAPMFVAGIGFYLIHKNRNLAIANGIVVYSLITQFFLLYFNHSAIIPYIIISLFYLLFYLFVNLKLRFIVNKVTLFFGSISYSLYLIHENIGAAIIFRVKQFIDYQIIYILVAFICVTSLAFLMTKYIEQPVLKMIRSHFKKNLLKSERYD